MSFNIDEDRVRNKNKDLLLTDKISAEEIEQAITDSKDIFLTRIYETFDTTINDSQFTNAMNIAVLLLTCSTLIRDNYSDQEQALSVAKEYSLEVDKIVKSIITGRELAKVSGVTHADKSRSIRTNSDDLANSFSSKIKDYYR